MSPKTFDFELVNQVGHVILNRPDRLNALTFESYAELRDFFLNCGLEVTLERLSSEVKAGRFAPEAM